MAAAVSGGMTAPMAVRMGRVAARRQAACAAMRVVAPRMPRRCVPRRRGIGAMHAAQARRAVRPRSPRGGRLREAVRVRQHGQCPVACGALALPPRDSELLPGPAALCRRPCGHIKARALPADAKSLCDKALQQAGCRPAGRKQARGRPLVSERKRDAVRWVDDWPMMVRRCGARLRPALAAKDEARHEAAVTWRRAGMPASSFRTRMAMMRARPLRGDCHPSGAAGLRRRRVSRLKRCRVPRRCMKPRRHAWRADGHDGQATASTAPARQRALASAARIGECSGSPCRASARKRRRANRLDRRGPLGRRALRRGPRLIEQGQRDAASPCPFPFRATP